MILLKNLLSELFRAEFIATGIPEPEPIKFTLGVTKTNQSALEVPTEKPYRITVLMGNMPQRIHYPITQEELDGLNLIPGEKSFIDTHQLNRINLPERIRREMIKNLNLIDITSVERKN